MNQLLNLKGRIVHINVDSLREIEEERAKDEE
jgi:hypothetical protein